MLILSHELGHLAMARAAGITTRHFTVGFGLTFPRWTDRRGTVRTFAVLPLGSYVTFAGENDTSVEDGYAGRHPAVRMAVIAADPAANLLVAITIYAGILALSGQPTFLPVASSVLPGSAAAVAGFRPGDRVLAVDGQPVATFDQLRPILQRNPGERLSFHVDRDHRVVDLFARLGTKVEGNREVGFLTIWSTARIHRALLPGATLVAALTSTWHVVTDTLAGIAHAVSTGEGIGNFAGVPRSRAHLAGHAAVAGSTNLLTLMAVLSVNLALMNLLPIPVLDGGAFLFCCVEWIGGRPASPRVHDFATRLGAAAIATLFAVSTIHDLAGFGLFRWLAML
jgi:regulator of sigma E protease